MKEIEYINEDTKSVMFKDGTTVNLREFRKKFRDFFQGRIAGETVVFSDMERFMSRVSSKNLSQLVKSKKLEGYMEGSMDKLLTKGQKIALATVVTLIMVGLIAIVVLNQQGILNF